MRILNNCIVDIFATFRRENGLSLRDAEKLVGLSNGYLSKIESRRREPSPAFYIGVSEAIKEHYGEISHPNKVVEAKKHPMDKATEWDQLQFFA